MENRNPSFYHIPWFERLWWYRSQFLQTLHGFNPSVKVHAPENPYKNGEFLMCFYREKPSEIRYWAGINRRYAHEFNVSRYLYPGGTLWELVTSNSQSKTRMLKTTSWVECGSSLLKLPDVAEDSAASKEEIKIGRLSFKLDEGNKWIFVFFSFTYIRLQLKKITLEFISEALQHQLML